MLIILLATGMWKRIFYPETNDNLRTMIVTPEASASLTQGQSSQIRWDESLSTKIPMEDGEIVIAILNRESEEGLAEEQIVAYSRNPAGRGVFITYIAYDEISRSYKRMWDAQTAATRTETISLFSQDLIGDRNNCIIVTGMNNRNEHTMTIFRKSERQLPVQAFNKIAEIQIDGSIIIQDTVRSLAYQQGITTGLSYDIAAYGHDRTSSNILDQIETIFSYNPLTDKYEQTRLARVPGSQIEQRRLRELLSGSPGVFENFINDLWYYVSPQGTVDTRQYIYFDPGGREIIFYGDEAQQVFQWQTSMPTGYGIYIRSQNISITTLLRFINIELESLDSIRLRVVEDVRLRIAANTTWDGSYRRAGAAAAKEAVSAIRAGIDALYDSTWGRIRFNSSGEYAITSGTAAERNGRYVFFKVDEQELLELRPEEDNTRGENRMVYRIDSIGNGLSLTRVRLGTAGIQDLFEQPVILTPVE